MRRRLPSLRGCRHTLLAGALASLAAPTTVQAATDPQVTGPPPPLLHPLADDEARLLGPRSVMLTLTVGVDGAVTAVALVTSAGNDALDRAAIAYARQLTFAPARNDADEAQTVTVPLTLTFTPPPAVLTSAVPAPAPAPAPAPHAHDEDERHDDDAGAPRPLDTTTVRHRRASAPPTSTSDLHIVPGALKGVPRKTAGEMLSLAPGVLLQNHGGEGHPEGIFLRGFDAGEGQDLELLLEGVPLNAVSAAHGHGFADTNVIVPLLVEELRIVEGPFDPRQGDFAVAGSADYTLGKERPGLAARVSYGQFNTVRAEAAYSPNDAPDLFVGGRVSASDNSWGPARAASGAALNGGGTVHLSDTLDVRVLAAASTARYDNAGVVREDDLSAKRLPCGDSDDEQFFCSYDQGQGGALHRGLLSATASLHLGEVHLDQQVFGLYGRSRTVEDFTGFISDPAELGGSQRGDAVEFNDDRLTFGARSRLRRRFELFGALNDFELGVFARNDHATIRGSRLRASDRAPYATVFDHDVDVTNLAGYASLRLVPLPFLAISGGARLDSFFFAVEDRTRPASDRDGARLTRQGSEAFGSVFQPRASVAWRLLRIDSAFVDNDDDDDESTSVLASMSGSLTWQTSVGTGARSSDAAALADGEAAPFADVRAAETGLTWQSSHPLLSSWPRLALEARIAAFSTAVSRDLVFDEGTGRNVDIGQSLRLGSWAMTRATIGDVVDLQVSGAFTEAYLVGKKAPAIEDVGTLFDGTTPRLPYVPRFVSRADTSVRHEVEIFGETFAPSLSAGATWVPSRPIPLEQFAEPIFVVDAAARVRWTAFELGVTATNLLDARYQQAAFNFVSNFRGRDQAPSLVAANHFVAGAPRVVMVELSIALEDL